MWEQTGVIVAGDAECMCCVTMGPRIHNQHHRDDLAVVQDGGRAASLPWAVLRFKRLTAVTDQHEPERDASIQHSSVIWRTAPAQPALPPQRRVAAPAPGAEPPTRSRWSGLPEMMPWHVVSREDVSALGCH